jgi:hypothetical protein
VAISFGISAYLLAGNTKWSIKEILKHYHNEVKKSLKIKGSQTLWNRISQSSMWDDYCWKLLYYNSGV